MQFSAVLNIFIVKTKLNFIFTNDLKRKDFFSKNVHSYRPSLFKHIVLKLLGISYNFKTLNSLPIEYFFILFVVC